MFALCICDLLIIWVVTCFTAVTVNSLWTKRCSPASETEHFDLKKLMTGISTSFYAACRAGHMTQTSMKLQEPIQSLCHYKLYTQTSPNCIILNN